MCGTRAVEVDVPVCEAAVEPTENWTHERLDTYAAAQKPPVDLDGATTRADKVARLAAARPQTPDGTPLSDPTPA